LRFNRFGQTITEDQVIDFDEVKPASSTTCLDAYTTHCPEGSQVNQIKASTTPSTDDLTNIRIAERLVLLTLVQQVLENEIQHVNPKGELIAVSQSEAERVTLSAKSGPEMKDTTLEESAASLSRGVSDLTEGAPTIEQLIMSELAQKILNQFLDEKS